MVEGCSAHLVPEGAFGFAFRKCLERKMTKPSEQEAPKEVCKECRGTRKEVVVCDQGQHGFTIDCGACGGKGYVRAREQPAGEGMTEELTEVDIDEIGVCLHNDVGPEYQEHMCKKLRSLRERERLLIAACEAAGEVIGLAESATERYEVLAEAFYRETCKMAPGKSVPLAMAMNDDEDRRKMWDHWVNARMTACRGLLRAAIRK